MQIVCRIKTVNRIEHIMWNLFGRRRVSHSIMTKLFTSAHHCVKMLSPSRDSLSYKPCHSYIRRLFWSDGCILLTSLSVWDKIFRGSEVNEMYLTDQEQRCLVFKRWRNYDKKTLTDNLFLILWTNERPGLT